MSERGYHSGGGQTETEEHLHINGTPARKAVGLFASTPDGDVVELSAASTATGSVLRTEQVNSSPVVFTGNVTLNPSSAHVGSVSIFGSINASVGMQTLFPGPNQIGSVTVSNTVPVTGTFWQSTQPVSFDQLVSLASGTEVRSLATVLNFPATQTVDGTINAAQSGSWDIRSLLSTATIYAVVNTSGGNSNVTLNPGPNQIGSVTVSNFTAPNTGNVTLNPSSSHIGSVSIFGDISTTPGMTTLFPGPNSIGLVTLNPSSAHIGSVSIFGDVTTTPGMTTLFPGPNQIGSVTISNFTAPNTGNVTLNPGPNFVGLVTIGNTPSVNINNLLSLASGTELRSLATLLNQPALVASTAYIGLASVNIGGTLPALTAGTAQIGSVTVSPIRSMATSLATLVSAAGNTTLFTPPSGQRFYIHNMQIMSQGKTDGHIRSGTKPIWPFASLVTASGFVHAFDNPGLPATAINEAFVVNINSAATISVGITCHFE